MFNKIFWVFLEKGGITILQFITLVILGRLLTPEDYGVYGIMTVFIAVSDMLVDSGFGGALVYKKDINQEDVNTLFYVNVGISVLLYFFIFLVSPLLEDYYDIIGLSSYLRVLGFSIILFAFSQVQNAILVRNLEFRKSAIIYLTSYTLSSIIAIMMASFGAGVWALVSQAIANALFVSSFLWFRTKTAINLNVSKSSLHYLWNFGSNLLFANLLQTVVNNISTSIIPKIANVAQAGNYFQATKIHNIPTSVLTVSVDKFSFPVLSKEKDLPSLKEKARYINKYFFLLFLPIFPLLSYCSFPLIHIILGAQWDSVSYYFSILCWSGQGLLIQGLYRNILKSMGLTRNIMYIEIIKSVLTLTGIVMCARVSVDALIYCIVCMSYVGVCIWSFCVKKYLNFSYLEQIKDFASPCLMTLLIYFSLFLIPIPINSYIRLSLFPFVYVIYFSLNLIFKQKEAISLYNDLKTVKSKHE